MAHFIFTPTKSSDFVTSLCFGGQQHCLLREKFRFQFKSLKGHALNRSEIVTNSNIESLNHKDYIFYG